MTFQCHVITMTCFNGSLRLPAKVTWDTCRYKPVTQQHPGDLLWKVEATVETCDTDMCLLENREGILSDVIS